MVIKMYRDSIIYKITFILAVIGIISLYGVNYFLKPKFIPLPLIDETLIGQHIRTEGIVESVVIRKSTTFLILKDRYNKINAVAFKPLKVKKGEKIEVEGIVDIYKNKLEIIIKKVRK